MRVILTLAGACLVATSAEATNIAIDVEIPRMSVAEYHKPYIAAWISTPNRKVVANLAVWYQLTNSAEGHGTKWLKDIRQWWRRTGRTLDMPVDGVSGPTKAPGTHTIAFTDSEGVFATLTAGDYILHVEASREVGGREHLTIPFKWDSSEEFIGNAAGSTELGKVSLTIKP